MAQDRIFTLATIPRVRRGKAASVRIKAPDLDVAVHRAKRAGFDVVRPAKEGARG